MVIFQVQGSKLWGFYGNFSSALQKTTHFAVVNHCIHLTQYIRFQVLHSRTPAESKALALPSPHHPRKESLALANGKYL